MIVKKNIILIGSFSGDARSHSLALQFIAKHQHNFPFKKMITGRYRLDDFNIAHQRMKAMQEIKPVILVRFQYLSG
jgi:Zn-dependent alcohol dehydrogenase